MNDQDFLQFQGCSSQSKAMVWTIPSDGLLKRPYPFGNEVRQLSNETPVPNSLLVQGGGPLCLLGSVVSVKAQLRRHPSGYFFSPPPLIPKCSSVVIEVSPKGDYFELIDPGWSPGERDRPESNAFAHLDKGFCNEARALVCFGVVFRACMNLERWTNFRRTRNPHSTKGDATTFAVDVNVYSLRHHADKVGSILMKTGIFLQRPLHEISSSCYYNPQILHFDGFQERPEEMVYEPEETSTPQLVVDLPVRRDPKQSADSPDHVELILDSLSHTSILHEICTDVNRIKSTLQGHQMKALDFISQRESGKLPTELTLWREKRTGSDKYYQHLLTNNKASERREARGGMIADDMGLGKSLTMLSAIARSLDEAEAFGKSGHLGPPNAPVPSRATLIIVPSIILVDSWIDEIRTHTYPHKVTFHKHLGIDRHSELHLLLEKDIVFTTFATALEDNKKDQPPLAKVHWFRIVLDEAHKIRNRTTQQFKVVHRLPAQRRWCLTGTPIQNRIEDLGSLVEFLRVPELERASTFRTCIVAPTSPERGSQFQNLRTLLKTICLRRTRDILGLPDPIPQLRELPLSEDEHYRYNEMYELYKRQVQMAVSGVGKVASTTLRSIHELRLFCNNGPRKTNGEPGESDDEMFSYLQQLDLNMCANCSRHILCIDRITEGKNGVFILPCKHLVCNSCFPQCLDKKKRCTLCASGKNPPEVSSHTATEASDLGPEESAIQYPSKLLALVQDIRMVPGEKCIVFSSWKKTLDLATELLKQSGLRCSIIHGTLSSKQRQKVLKEFRSILGPPILLMTLGTGAEGLNLTIASRIYLLEPQWNPFLEMQAMARAQRIGQTKQVVCIRYVMKDTIEQSDVLNRQKRKTALAGGGFKMHDSLRYFKVDAPNIPVNIER